MAAEHRAPDEKPDPRAREVRDRRPGPKHAADTPPKKRAPRKKAAAPASAPPASAPPAPSSSASSGDRARSRRARALAGEAQEYARRQAVRATTGKPSTVGRAASGAAAGAASGAAIGSVVPGIGTAVGAGAGAVLGGAGGAVSGHKAKRAYKSATRANAGARRAIVAEFLICMVIVALAPMTDRKRTEKPGDQMKRMTAVLGLFFILGLISAAGRGAGKAAAGLGGLVTVGLVVSERDLFTKLAAVFSAPSSSARGSGPGLAEQAADAAAEGAIEAAGEAGG